MGSHRISFTPPLPLLYLPAPFSALIMRAMKSETSKTTQKPTLKSGKTSDSCSKAVTKTQETAQTPQEAAPELKLKLKQEIFVREYLVDLDATKAAIRSGYSERSARAIGAENLTKPHIKAAIDAEIERRKERICITEQEVIKELALIGLADMSDFVQIDESGAIRAISLDSLAEGRSRIIKKVKDKRTSRKTQEGDELVDSFFEFELCDKVKSLELLARHLGILHDKQEVDLKQPVQITIKKFCSRKSEKKETTA